MQSLTILVQQRGSNHLPTISVTLVGRLCEPADGVAWGEFDRRYRDLIVRFLCGRGLQLADAEDSVRAVPAQLVKGLRSFEYSPMNGGFRAYLFRCADAPSPTRTPRTHRLATIALTADQGRS